MRRKLVLALLALFVVGLLISQGNGIAVAAKTIVTVEHDGTSTVTEYFSKVIKDAERLLPDIEIKSVPFPSYDDLVNQLPSQIAAGTVPDIVWWDAVIAPQFIQAGVVTPLSAEVLENIDRNEYVPSVLNTFAYDGSLYGIPIQSNTTSLVINMDIFNELGIGVPTTVDEFKNAAIEISKSGKTGIVVQLNAFQISQYVSAFGGGWEFGKTINSEKNIEAIEFLVELFHTGAAESTLDLGYGWDGEAFGTGEVGMATGGPWYISFMQAVAPEMDYMLMPLPAVEGVAMFSYGSGFSVMENSKNKEAAMKVLRYLASDNAQELLYTTEYNNIPAKEKFLDEYVEVMPKFASLKEGFLKGTDLEYPYNMRGFDSDLTMGVEQLIYNPGSLTAKQLLDTLQRDYGIN